MISFKEFQQIPIYYRYLRFKQSDDLSILLYTIQRVTTVSYSELSKLSYSYNKVTNICEIAGNTEIIISINEGFDTIQMKPDSVENISINTSRLTFNMAVFFMKAF